MYKKRSFLAGCFLAAGFVTAQFMNPVCAQQADDTYELEEIIVTAARREQNIQDISGVVQSFTAAELRRDGVDSFRDLQISVPGLNISNQEGNLDIFIRGVGSANNTELGDPGSAPHINGVYIPRPRGLGGQFYDVERVEINKGPQGTLYGRNALGGTLNLITKKVSLDGNSDGYFQADAQSRSGFGLEAATDIQISQNTGFRIAGFYKEADAGFVNSGVTSQLVNSGDIGTPEELAELGITAVDEAGLSEDYGARVSFTSEISEKLSLNIIADYGKETGTGFPGSNLQPALAQTNEIAAAEGSSFVDADDFNLRSVRYRGFEGDLDSETFGILTNLEYDFGSFKFDGSLSYRGVRFNQINAQNAGTAFDGNAEFVVDDFSTVRWETNSDAVIGDFRLVSTGDGPLEWSVGLFGFDESQEVSFITTSDRGFCCFSAFESTQPDVDGQSIAVYGDFTLNITDSVRLFGGLRYTDEEKSRLNGLLGSVALLNFFDNGDTDFACCFGSRFFTPGTEFLGLDRPSSNFSSPPDPNAPNINQLNAQLILDGFTFGPRDDFPEQLGPVAAGTSATGECIAEPDNDNGFATCPPSGFFSNQIISAPFASNGTFEDDFIDGRLGVEWDVSDQQLIYAKFTSGTKSGGFNDNIPGTNIAPEFDTETLFAWEIGSRYDFTAFGNPGNLNVTAFYYDYQDQVFQTLTAVGDSLDEGGTALSLLNSNVSDSNIWGFEIESRFVFPGDISLDIFATILQSEIESGEISDARFADFSGGTRPAPSPLADVSGNDLPNVSDWEVTARLGQEIELSGGNIFDWQIIAKYRDDFFLTPFNNQDIVDFDVFDDAGNVIAPGQVFTVEELGQDALQEGYATVNIGFGYTFSDGRFRIEAFGSNIFDETASEKSLVGNDLNLRFLNEARTWGIRGVTRF